MEQQPQAPLWKINSHPTEELRHLESDPQSHNGSLFTHDEHTEAASLPTVHFSHTRLPKGVQTRNP